MGEHRGEGLAELRCVVGLRLDQLLQLLHEGFVLALDLHESHVLHRGGIVRAHRSNESLDRAGQWFEELLEVLVVHVPVAVRVERDDDALDELLEFIVVAHELVGEIGLALDDVLQPALEVEQPRSRLAARVYLTLEVLSGSRSSDCDRACTAGDL